VKGDRGPWSLPAVGGSQWVAGVGTMTDDLPRHTVTRSHCPRNLSLFCISLCRALLGKFDQLSRFAVRLTLFTSAVITTIISDDMKLEQWPLIGATFGTPVQLQLYQTQQWPISWLVYQSSCSCGDLYGLTIILRRLACKLT